MHFERAYDRQKTLYGRNCRPMSYQIGDLVRRHRPVPPPGVHKKFHPPWSAEPYRIERVMQPNLYVIRASEHTNAPLMTVHHNNLTLLRGQLATADTNTKPLVPESDLPPVDHEDIVPTTSTEDSFPFGGGYCNTPCFTMLPLPYKRGAHFWTHRSTPTTLHTTRRASCGSSSKIPEPTQRPPSPC